MSDDVHEVNERERETLIAWLGDTPETAMSIHRLRRGLGRGLVLGPVDRPEAVIVQAYTLAAEPAGFGDDPKRFWTLLRNVEGWKAVHVTPALGPPLADVIERETGHVGALIEDIYYVLDRPITPVTHPAVRMLTSDDVPLVEAATDALGMHGWRFGSAAALVSDGFVAGAVVDGALVAAGFTSNRSDRHAEVGIVTREDHRNRGLSTAAGSLVCATIHAAGLIPVWSTSEENVASRRVAAKLGFREVSRRVYVNRR